MENHRPDVTQALTTAGWAPIDSPLPSVQNGPAYWVMRDQNGASILGTSSGWIAEFAPDAPVVVIVAAALAAAGQPAKRLAEVIPLPTRQPEATP